MYLNFDILGELIATEPSSGLVLSLAEIGDVAHPFIASGILKPVDAFPEKWTLSGAGLARFVANHLSLGEPRRFAGVYALGSTPCESVFYSPSPPPNFYATHPGAASVVLGSNHAAVPNWWQGASVLLSELFYLNPANEIMMDAAARRRIITASAPRFTPVRRPHERRRAYLRFFVDYFLRPFAPSNISRGHLSYAFLREWFREHTSNAPSSLRTYRRDIAEFTAFNPKTDIYDKREELVAVLWRLAPNPSFPHGEATARRLSEILLKLQQEEDASPRGKAVEIGKAAWQWLGNERVLTACA